MRVHVCTYAHAHAYAFGRQPYPHHGIVICLHSSLCSLLLRYVFFQFLIRFHERYVVVFSSILILNFLRTYVGSWYIKIWNKFQDCTQFLLSAFLGNEYTSDYTAGYYIVLTLRIYVILHSSNFTYLRHTT